jgi:hypothetical protein
MFVAWRIREATPEASLMLVTVFDKLLGRSRTAPISIGRPLAAE